MASPNAYNPGGSSGARLATRKQLYHSGSIWYVATGGVDAAAPAGRSRLAPLATISQAHTNASAGDTIQILPGYTLSPSANLTITKAGLHLYSEGEILLAQNAQITIAGAVIGFTLNAAGIWMENWTFPTPTVSGAQMVEVTAANCQFVNCKFTANENVTGRCVRLGAGANSTRLVGCTFTGAGSSASARPVSALEVSAAISDLDLDTVIFDGGTFGWSSQALLGGAAVTRLNAIDTDFLNDSDLITATASIYRVHVRNESGSARKEFTA